MKQKLYKILCNILRFFTRIYLWRTKPLVIGITGSVGKTCCRDIVTQVLKETQSVRKVYTSPKNYNSELGLIFSIFQIEDYDPSVKNILKLTLSIIQRSLIEKKSYDILVAEYGIDSPGDMDFLLSVMKPDIAILTKLDSVHSNNFPRGKTEYWEDKWKLLLGAKEKVFLNRQDSLSQQNIGLLSRKYEYMFGGTLKTIIKKLGNSIQQEFIYEHKKITINLLGDENIEYTILGLKISQNIGTKLTENEYNFEFVLQPGRFSIFEKDNNIFVDSSYNAGPESMKKIIDNTKKLQQELYPQKDMIYILGDMREIGEIKQEAHENIAHQILESTAVFTIGPDMYQYMIPKLKRIGYSGEIHSSLSSREIGKKLKNFLKNNNEKQYLALVKGSQNTIFTEEALASQLTVGQRKNLPRQSEDWKSKKEIFFKNL